MKKILFTGGGSAGHVVPNIALFEQLLSEGETDVCYMGTNGIEKRILSEWKVPFYEIECPKLVRGGGISVWKRNAKIPFSFFRAVKDAKRGLRVLRPDAVFSKGGYVALPVVIAAWQMKIPCYAHESDFSAGLANRISARFCKKIFTSFPETAKKLKRGVFSGAPVKRSVFACTRAEARKKYGIGFQEKVLLVFGGGSGSEVINQAIRAQLKTLTKTFVVLHACGKGNLADIREKGYIQTEFIKDMGTAYACADAVVSRAGAGTVFELLALKKPALLIPLEGQTRGDQIENAEYFEKRGLCRVLKQSELSRLSEEAKNTLEDTELKKRLSAHEYPLGNERILSELKRAIQNG